MDTTIAITWYKRPDDLQRLINSIEEHPQLSQLPRKVMDTEGNLSRARNLLFKDISTEGVFLLEEDMKVPKTLNLKHFEHILDIDQEVGCVGCQILCPLGTPGSNIHFPTVSRRNIRRIRQQVRFEQDTSVPLLSSKRVPYVKCDFIMNAGLFRRDMVLDLPYYPPVQDQYVAFDEAVGYLQPVGYGWDEEQEIIEHLEFFWRLKKQENWTCAFLPHQHLYNYRSRPNEEYNQARDRAKKFQDLQARKIGQKPIFVDKENILVPRVFHRVWLGGDMPLEYVRYGETWLENHPGWMMYTWSEDNLEPLKDLINWGNYAATRTYSEKSDFIRHAVLRKYGGVYIDTDFECLQCIEPLLANVSGFAASENGTHVSCGILGCVPNHAFFKETNEALFNDWAPCGKNASKGSGPQFVTNVFNKSEHRNKMVVFSPELFYPVKYKDENPPTTFPIAYGIHHWAASWMEKKEDTEEVGTKEDLDALLS